MAYYRSCTTTLIGLGISCLIVVPIIGEMQYSLPYLVGGIVLIALGIIGIIIKYYIKKSENAGQKIKIWKTCSVCSRLIVDKNLEVCPDCGNKL